MNDKLLFVDDEENILSGYKRSLRRSFDIDTATSGQEGLALLEKQGPYPVVVSDMRMPHMNGVEFLTKVCQTYPDTVRIMLTGQADMSDAILAVNEGNIFRFLTKPCDPDTLTKAIQAGIRQYQLVKSEKELLEKTLKGSINILTNILSMVNAEAFSRGDRIKRYINHMVNTLALDQAWQYELAAMLSQIGLVTVPADVMQKYIAGGTLDDNEKMMIESSPSISHDLLMDIPRFDKIAKMIAWQQEAYNNLNDTSEYSRELTEKEQIKTGAQILKITLFYDTQCAINKLSHLKVIDKMLGQPDLFNPNLVKILKTFSSDETIAMVQEVNIFNLTTRMILDQDIKTNNNVFLASQGMEVTLTLIKFLENYVCRNEVHEMVKVKVLK